MRVIIVGGGIAGLATAYHLQQRSRSAGIPIDCRLVEGDRRLGGKIVTFRENGFLVEGGPDSFLTQKPWALELCRELGLGDRLVGTNEAGRGVFILWKGKLRRLPDGVLLVIPTRFAPFALSTLISPIGKLRMGLDLVIPRKRGGEDESVASFVRRRLGSEALDKIAEPLMGGIHTSDPERQSLLGTFPRFAEMERRYGSLIRAMLAARRHRSPNGKALPAFMSLGDGLEGLVDALVSRLDSVKKLRGTRAVELQKGYPGGYRLTLDDGAALEADAVVLAIPAREAAALVENMDDGLAGRLRSMRYVSTATVSLAFRQNELPSLPDGFGFVIPRKEQRSITGCTFSSTKFPNRAPEGYALLRCFLGSANNDAPALLPESEMVDATRDELRSIMGIRAEPVLTQVYRWQGAHPQYDVGHPGWLAEIDRMVGSHPGLYLAGSSYRGVGLPDCIRGGIEIADGILKEVLPPQPNTLPEG